MPQFHSKPKVVAYEWRDPARLTDHPLHRQIYGDDLPQYLVDSIKLQGVITPLLITGDGVVISGRSRRVAAIDAKIEKVNCAVLDAGYSNEELRGTADHRQHSAQEDTRTVRV